MSSVDQKAQDAEAQDAKTREARTRDARAQTPDPEPDTSATTKASNAMFGRGLLYVVVWALQLVASSLISPVLAHVMPASQFGALSSAIALFQVLSVFAVIGLDQATVLQRSEDGHDRRARGLVVIAIGVAFTVMAIALATMPLWRDALGFGNEPLIVVAVILWTGPSAAVSVCLGLLLAQDRLRIFATISIISAVGGSVVGIVLVATVRDDATTYAWGGVICQFIAMAIAVSVVRPTLRGLDRDTARRAVRFGVPLALGNLAYFVLNAGDRIIIQRLIGPEEVARYQVAYVVGSAVILLLTFTNQAWTPHFAALKDDASRWALGMRSRDQLYRLLMPIVLAVTLVSPFALPILAPASYHTQSLTVVVFLVAITAYPVAASGSTGRLLLIGRRSVAIGVIAGIGAVVNIGVNFALIPLMGIAGAAAATFISYGVLAFLQQRIIPKRPVWHGPPATLVIGILASLAVAGGSILLPQDTWWNLGRLVAAVACFPWFLNRLRAARDQPPKARVRGAHRSGRATRELPTIVPAAGGLAPSDVDPGPGTGTIAIPDAASTARHASTTRTEESDDV